MKLPFCSAIGLSLMLASCSSLDPDYAEYKKKKKAEAAAGAQAPFAPGADPAASNPFAAPGGSEVGSYSPTGTPLQPLPGVNPAASLDPISPSNYPSPTPGPSFPNIPSAPGSTIPHVVVQGDSLWALAKRHGTTIEAIKAANGMTDDTIQTGRTLQIPR